MNMTLEGDQKPHLHGIPWFQRTRPGVHRDEDGKPMRAQLPATASPAGTVTTSADHLTKELAMSNDARKQRHLREVAGDSGDEIPIAEVACLSVVVTALILFAAIALSGCNWDERKIVVVSASDRVAPIVATVDRR